MLPVNELDIYKLSEKLADIIWDEFDNWPAKVKNTIGYQIIRSVDSISANLAEGFGRYTPADRKKFYRYSRGSFEETKAWLSKLHRREIIKGNVKFECDRIIGELGPKLNAFINKTR